MTSCSDPSALADLINALDACLPQTQCTRCGYPRCRAYAQALAQGEADLNQCPPGGAPTIDALAALLQVPPKPLNRAHGEPSARVLARIDERLCIGCRKCIDVCPVDAILGAPKQMHTVIARECNGCALCMPVCPVDCIALLPVPGVGVADSRWPDYSFEEPARWRRRTQARVERLSARKRRVNARGAGPLLPPPQARKAEIQAALARVRLKKSPR
jgi:electron transport complex protein RnfB